MALGFFVEPLRFASMSFSMCGARLCVFRAVDNRATKEKLDVALERSIALSFYSEAMLLGKNKSISDEKNAYNVCLAGVYEKLHSCYLAAKKFGFSMRPLSEKETLRLHVAFEKRLTASEKGTEDEIGCLEFSKRLCMDLEVSLSFLLSCFVSGINLEECKVMLTILCRVKNIWKRVLREAKGSGESPSKRRRLAVQGVVSDAAASNA